MSSTCPERAQHPAPATRVIAHRGASGYLPEHSAAAKTLAYGLGADFLEQDVVATRDGNLVVLHDVHLDDVSDVAARFPDRRRADGRHYVVDFTVAELERLSLCERRAPGSARRQYPTRFPFESSLFRIVRFADEIELVAGLNATTGRTVGIYPEIKDPAWHDRQDIDLTRLVFEALEHRRALVSGPVFVQSFDSRALKRLRDEFDSDWPRIQLLTGADARALSARPEQLAEIAGLACGVGLPYTSLIDAGVGATLRPSPLATSLAASGLLVHPYTLRRDSLEPGAIDYRKALEFLILELGVDALFCDQPDDAIAVRDGTAA